MTVRFHDPNLGWREFGDVDDFYLSHDSKWFVIELLNSNSTWIPSANVDGVEVIRDYGNAEPE